MRNWFKQTSQRQLRTSRTREYKRRSNRRLLKETLEQRFLLATVSSVDPAEHSFNALVSTNVSATFDEAITAGATADNFVVHTSQRPTTTTVTADGTTVTADPADNFFPGELVNVTATAGIQGTTAAAPHVWQFRTRVTSGSNQFVDTGQGLGAGPDNAQSAALGDFDGDGDLDLFLAKASNQNNELWVNDGSANFTESAQNLGGGNSIDAAVGDLDGDGDLDIFVANNNQASVVWRNDGAGTFTQGQTLGGGNSEAVDLADFDGDGDLDAFVGNRGQANRLYINNGTGDFTDSGQAMGGTNQSSEVEVGDLDGDGDIDAIVGNYYQPNRVWLNDGTGVLTDSGQAIAFNRASGLGLGDMDGDGDLDYVEANISGGFGSRLFLNDGTGVFVDSGQAIGGNRNSFSIAIGDMDGDGDLDYVVGNNQTNGVYLNDGSGIISAPAPFPGINCGGAAGCFDPGSTRRTPLGDLDGDGDLDVVTANTNGGNPAGSRVWIQQNLTPNVTLSIDNATIAEAAGAASVTATLSAVFGQDVTVELEVSGSATEGDDYVLSGTQIVIPAGSTTGTVTVTAVQDTLDEPDETVLVDIASVTNGQGSGQVSVTITDDDEPIVPNVTLGVDNLSIAEAGGIATFTATLSAATTVDVTVGLAVSGTASAADYSISGDQIVIGAGATSGSITVTGVDDTENESGETVIIDIDSVTNGTEDGSQQATTTIEDDDVPPSLRVDSLTSTSTGFVALFNNDLTPDVLNLYDNATAGAGPADVVLSGASSGTIAGSLVIGARSIEFIQTDEALGADTYTVTLRSAADGFSAGTDLLDGNGDGTGGDDYNSSFTIAAPASGAVTVSVPDIVRGPGQPVNVPATGTGLPLTLSDGAGVRNVTLSVDYDPALLRITGAEVGAGLPAGAAVTVDTSVEGTAVVTFTSPADLAAGEASIVNLTSAVPTANAADIYGTKQVLNIHSISITDGSATAIPAIENDGLHLSEYFADVSGNRRVNAADAAQVARVAALIDGGFGQSLSTDPTIIGDVSGNGRINAADASLVAQVAALIPVDQVPEIPSGAFSASGRSSDLQVLNDDVAVLGPTLQLPADFGQAADSAAVDAAVIDQSTSDLGFADLNLDGNTAVEIIADQRDLETLLGEDLDNELLADIADRLASLLGRSE